MEASKFQQLLCESESQLLDFKLEPYDFSASDPEEKSRRRAKFVKDIVSFANTPRSTSAYIILGVKKHADGKLELRGIQTHIDDNEYQQCVEAWVYPFPFFSYQEVTFEGKQFGVIEIPCELALAGPFFPTTQSRGGEMLRPAVLYWRRGSKNTEAAAEERNYIHSWFAKKVESPLPLSPTPEWTRFSSLAALGQFGHRYVLLLGLDRAAQYEESSALAALDWGLVIDFDPNSESDGVLSKVRPTLSQRRAIHISTKGDALTSTTNRSTDWYFSRGLRGRESSIPGVKWKDWLNAYSSDFRTRLERFAASGVAPVIAIAVWTDSSLEQHLRRSLETVLETFGETASLVVVTDTAGNFTKIANEVGADIVELELRHFFNGLSIYQAKLESSAEDIILLPGIEGTEKQISIEDFVWLEEDLEVIHLGLGTRAPENVDQPFQFLRGATISWFELGLHVDAERDKTSSIQRVIRDDLLRRQATRVNLYHRPGAGGSTVSRRIVWDLRREFPTVILRRCDPRGTAERIAWLFQLTEKPLLVLREGSTVDEGHADDLFRILRSRNVPFVIFQVLRRHEMPIERDRIFSLDAALSLSETFRFVEILAREAPSKRQKLSVLSSTVNGSKTPFIFGLTAFEEDFKGITPYVQQHLAELPLVQRKIVLFLSLAHKYGHSSVNAQNFAEFIGVPSNRAVDLNLALSPGARGLLVEGPGMTWRTAHELIASEVIRQVLSEGQRDPRNWRANLVDFAIEFADFCNPTRPIPSEELKTLVERVFIFRDDNDPLGTTGSGLPLFSSLLNDIPTAEGRLRLFLKLVEIFPGHEHLWAHLGRFYSVEMHRLSDAITAIDRAIYLNPNDHVLHHMKGMAFRKQVYDDLASNGSIEQVIANGKLASSCFAIARRLAPDDEHGYISEVQLLLRVLDRLSVRCRKNAVLTAAEASEEWLRESFQMAEDLLQDVRHLRRGERPSNHEEESRAQLDSLYGAHEIALQRWQNLLDRKGGGGAQMVFAPPIRRQIVWTYLARNGRTWRGMPQKDLNRAIELLNKNIEEQPDDGRSYRLWMQGARYLSPPPSLDYVLERMAYWKTSRDDLDPSYYIFVMAAIQAINGSTLSAEKARRALEEVRIRTRSRLDRTASFEWLGKGDGLSCLVQHESLGEWDSDLDFWRNRSLLMRKEGIVVSLTGPQAGEIEIAGGLRAFFTPVKAGIVKGRDENSLVTCYLGFSFDGIRAWSVERA
ncbi:MAG: RNA-binding domain-containing protein [Massilia sp.]